MPDPTDGGGTGVPVSRRKLTSLIVAGSLTGAVWTAGLSVLARGRHPQLFALGRDKWQVLLIEHGTNRVVMLVGSFERSPEREIDLLCGLLRQHIDVVVGNGAALDLLSTSFRSRRRVPTMVRIDGDDGGAMSPAYVSVTQPTQIEAGAFDMTLTPLPVGRWRPGDDVASLWIAELAIGDVMIAVGPTLDIVANHARTQPTVAIAPVGDVARLWRTRPGVTIATNSSASMQDLTRHVPTGTSRLVRTFSRDIAAFVFRDGQVRLPDWTQESAPD